MLHSLTAERLEVVRDLDHFAATEVRPARLAARRRRKSAQDLFSVQRSRRRLADAPRRPPRRPRRSQLVDLLKPVEKCWQCQDFMPDPSSPTFLDEVCPGLGTGAGATRAPPRSRARARSHRAALRARR